jgi:hypothetical protein
MDRDILDEMPQSTRAYLVAHLQETFEMSAEQAEAILRASEPFWNAMEDAGGFIDSWGGGEFSVILPRLLGYIRREEWR